MNKTMKNAISALLAAFMLLSLTACSPGEPAETAQQNVQYEPTQQVTRQDEQPEPTQQDVQLEVQPEEISYEFVSPKSICTALWELTYDEADGWVYEEDNLYNEETYSEVYLVLSTEDGEEYSVGVEICASVESASDFRYSLSGYGFDPYEYAVNNSYDRTEIGGISCLMYAGEFWGTPCLRYFDRVEEAGTTVYAEIFGDYENERVKKLLSGLTFHLKETGNVDPPWYWEGKAFTAQTREIEIGNHTLHSEWLPITDCIVTNETLEHCVAVTGQDVWLTVAGTLKRYSYDGTSLKLAEEIKSDEYFRSLAADETGTLWMGDPLVCFISWKDGVQTGSYDNLQKVAMHPSGAWGVNYWVLDGAECEKVIFSDGAATTQPMPLSEVGRISRVVVDENHIFVCGCAADETDHKVFVYDLEGNLRMTLTGADGEGLGSITYIAETSNGFLALDGNMREVVLWAEDGSYIGAADDGELFDTNDPWLCDAAALDEDSFLIIMTEDRADESATELIAFKLTIS